MGCNSVQKITIPAISVPKWKDETTVLEIEKSKPSEFTLLTDENIITIANGSILATPHNITSKESGFVALPPSSFMIVGGYDIQTSKDTNLCYKISFSSTENLADLLYPTRRMRLINHENYIYSIGGVRETHGNGINLEYTNNFFRYKDNIWEQLLDIPTGVEYPASFAYKDKIYVVGGCYVNGLSLEVVDNLQCFSLVLQEWSILKVLMPVCVYGLIAIPKDSNSFLLIGGIDCNNEPNSMVYIVGLQDSEEVVGIPFGISTFFPFSCAYDGSSVYLINDQKDLLCLNRLSRTWEVLNTLK